MEFNVHLTCLEIACPETTGLASIWLNKRSGGISRGSRLDLTARTARTDSRGCFASFGHALRSFQLTAIAAPCSTDAAREIKNQRNTAPGRPWLVTTATGRATWAQTVPAAYMALHMRPDTGLVRAARVSREGILCHSGKFQEFVTAGRE
jgi:hypothetical protein